MFDGPLTVPPFPLKTTDTAAALAGRAIIVFVEIMNTKATTKQRRRFFMDLSSYDYQKVDILAIVPRHCQKAIA